MMPVVTGYGRLTCVLLSLWITGCAQSALHSHSPQEDLGMGIVSGTLGAQARSTQQAAEPVTSSVVGQVQALEGGAYLVRDVRGQEHRVPHDENTKIDRPPHVGDRIQSWFDRHGRAVLIRSVDEENR